MKKILVAAGISIATMIAASSCGSNPRKDTNNPAKDSTGGSSAIIPVPDNNVDNPRAQIGSDTTYVQGAVLIANNDCKTCHAIDKQMVGPSYNMIANKYSNTTGMRDELAYKINKGGSGRWGTKAMPAHPLVGIPNGNLMAGYILSLKTK